ncbi:MAG: hypothetical protein PHD95_01395 [Candidatus ainarchaeum sp.]|nr:hypothetical protein [Candidatus ainarchaeum sp.]
MEKFPKIDLSELKKEMELNRQQRLEFVRVYAEWLKKTPNKVWSKQQAKYMDK